MRQVFIERGQAIIKEVAQPLLDDHSVLVSVAYSFISSGTEAATIANAQSSLLRNVPQKIKKVVQSLSIHGIEGTKALVKSKLQGEVQAIGYSCSGTIIAVGRKVTQLKIGDFVACAGAGIANHADVVCVPKNLAVKIGDEKFLKAASLTTIGSIALQGIRRADIKLGEIVCVIGLGLIGQLTIQLAKIAGCTVIGIDLESNRLDLAKKFGADYVYHAKEDDIEKEIDFLTHHMGVDVTIITAASKSDDLVQQAMEITRKKGKVIVVGDVGLSLKRDPLYTKEIDFLISCSYGPGRYDYAYEYKGRDYPYAYVRWTEHRNMQAVVQLIEKEQLHIEELISATIDVEKVNEAYECLKCKDALGVVLSYGSKDKKERELEDSPRFIPAVKDANRIAIVGAGGFAKVKLLPLISKMPNTSITAIVDADNATSSNVARLYGVQHRCISDQELWENDHADSVVIASPHKFHCAQALNALQRGKAVFLEKPMVTDFDQLKQFKEFLTTHPNARLCVDYNRSFSPFVQKIKQAIASRSNPFVMHYRVNAGYIPKEHWIQTDIGAGRIIGEACHIIDMFCYLTEAQPMSVSVEALHAGQEDIFPTDNFTAHIRFTDGSICSLLYTALGSGDLGKERMELFFDGKSIVMDDYTTLCMYGSRKASVFDETSAWPDKGHEALLTQFFDTINRDSYQSPISFERLLMTAELTLIIDKLACEGGGEQILGS